MLGCALEVRCRMVVCYTPNKEEVNEANQDDFKVGDAIVIVVQGFPLNPDEVKSRISDDTSFVDTDADIAFVPKLPSITQDPHQSYLTIKLTPHLEEDSDQDFEEEEVRRLAEHAFVASLLAGSARLQSLLHILTRRFAPRLSCSSQEEDQVRRYSIRPYHPRYFILTRRFAP